MFWFTIGVVSCVVSFLLQPAIKVAVQKKGVIPNNKLLNFFTPLNYILVNCFNSK